MGGPDKRGCRSPAAGCLKQFLVSFSLGQKSYAIWRCWRPFSGHFETVLVLGHSHGDFRIRPHTPAAVRSARRTPVWLPCVERWELQAAFSNPYNRGRSGCAMERRIAGPIRPLLATATPAASSVVAECCGTDPIGAVVGELLLESRGWFSDSRSGASGARLNLTGPATWRHPRFPATHHAPEFHQRTSTPDGAALPLRHLRNLRHLG